MTPNRVISGSAAQLTERLAIALEEPVEQHPPIGIGERPEDRCHGVRHVEEYYVTYWSHVKVFDAACVSYALVEVALAHAPVVPIGPLQQLTLGGTNNSAMRTFTASRRAIVATTVGLVLSLSLAACSQNSRSWWLMLRASVWAARFCSSTVISLPKTAEWFLRLPWQLGLAPCRPTGLAIGRSVQQTTGRFEVVDVPTGSVLARTGTRVILLTSDYQEPFNREGEFVVCGPVSPG